MTTLSLCSVQYRGHDGSDRPLVSKAIHWRLFFAVGRCVDRRLSDAEAVRAAMFPTIPLIRAIKGRRHCIKISLEMIATFRGFEEESIGAYGLNTFMDAFDALKSIVGHVSSSAMQ